jgi:hypothetical protein
VALRRVPIPSPNYSSRGGASVRLIVCHTAEGCTTYPSLGAYFQGDVGVSSHVGIDDVTPGEIGEYVAPGGKAWCQSDFNPQAVCVELCAFAHYTEADWWARPTMLANLAAWIGEESARFGIPLRILSAAEAQGGGVGVTQHVDLGAAGGGHTDCGAAFDILLPEVLAMAGGAPAPIPPPSAGAAPPPSSGKAPPWPGVYLSYPPAMYEASARTWQAQMQARGWVLEVDGWYGEESAQCCEAFQLDSTANGWPLDADGVVGAETWRATWERPVSA